MGIFVAIPAVIAYNLFQKKCNDIEENRPRSPTRSWR